MLINFPLLCATADAAAKELQKHVLEKVMWKKLLRMSNPRKVASLLAKIDFTELADSLESVSKEAGPRTLIVGIVAAIDAGVVDAFNLFIEALASTGQKDLSAAVQAEYCRFLPFSFTFFFPSGWFASSASSAAYT